MRAARGSRIGRVAAAIAISVLTCAAVMVGTVSWWLRGPSPGDEIHDVGGISGDVTVRRDALGIAHISAATETDAWAGLGFAMAQDRACQVELLWRLASGRISEWAGDRRLGPSLTSVELDRSVRELGFAQRADDSWAQADDRTRSDLISLARGANARLDSLRHHPPACFRLLGLEPRRWEPRDPLLLIEAFGFLGQAPSLRAQVAAGSIARHLGVSRAADLVPDLDAAEISVLVGTGPEANAAFDAGEATPIGDSTLGSNAWALSGERSRSGKPLLAADPHVRVDLAPTFWYLAHVSTPTLDAQGLFLPGTPLLGVGHNRNLAWGVTSTLVRTSGITVVDHPAPPSGAAVAPRSKPAPPERSGDTAGAEHEERIRVRWGKSVIESDTGIPRTRSLRHPWWLGLDEPGSVDVDLGPGDAARTLRGFLALARAPTISSCEPALADLRSGPLAWNLVLADTAGHIAKRIAAAIAEPRDGGQDRDPNAAVTKDPVPRMEITDPAEGVVVSANQSPNDLSRGIDLPGSFELPFRARRIAERLASEARWGPDDLRRIQLDVTSEVGRALVPGIVADLDGDPPLEVARRVLAAWDLECGRESPGCALFELTLERLPERAFSDELGPDRWRRYASVNDLPLRALLGIWAEPGSRWWDDVTTATAETRRDSVRRAVREALHEVQHQGGDEPDGWNWGAFHEIALANPLSHLPWIGRHFRLEPLPYPGDRYTIAAAGHGRRADGSRPVRLGPSSRFVIDLAAPEVGYFSSSTGMSEDPFSGYAWNLTDGWLAGELFAESLDGPREVRFTVTLRAPS